MTPGAGFLAIWTDIAATHETDYLHWLTREHTAERVGVPGFLGVRMFRAVKEDPRRYFILYELASPEVVDSPAYLARLNAPTPWSSRMMPHLGNFKRGGGALGRMCGMGSGGVIAVGRLASPGDAGPVEEQLPRLASMDRICGARTLIVDPIRTTVPTQEKSLRGGDDAFAGLLMVEGYDQPAVAAAFRVAGLAGDTYAQVFSLSKAALATGEGLR
jgi:hypothetical protein